MVGLKFVKTLEFGGASDCRPMKHVPMGDGLRSDKRGNWQQARKNDEALSVRVAAELGIT